MSDHIGDTHEMVKGYVEARVTRTEEIRARVEGEIVSELRFRVEVRDDEVLLRRKLHSGVSVGAQRSFTGTRVLELWNALVMSRTELQALREENARLKGTLEEIAREEALSPNMTKLVYGHKAQAIAEAALSPSPAQEQKK